MCCASLGVEDLSLFSKTGFSISTVSSTSTVYTTSVLGSVISHIELWDIKFISTLFWTITDLSAKTTSLIDIFETHQFFGGGLFRNNSFKSKYYIKLDK